MTRRIADLQGADPYALLEVPPEATAEDIQRAYRRVMREAHPDMATGDEDRTKLLNIARDVLLDPDLRAEYDRRALAVSPEPASAWDAEDVVDDTPTAYPPTRPAYNPYIPPSYSPPSYGQQPVYGNPSYGPPVYRPPAYQTAPSTAVGLGVWALVTAVLCSPLGAVLGVIALMQNPKPEGANKICAIVAVCWGGLALLCCLGYLAFAVFGSTLTTFSGA